MKNFLVLLALTLCVASSGCSSLKDATGEYVVEAVTQKVSEDVERLLEKRGLSLAEISDATDSNSDGELDRSEVIETVRDTAKDYLLLEAKTYIEDQMEKNSALAASKGDLDAIKYNFLNCILGLIAAYLGKQIVSAKKDGKRDERIAILEKLINRDIDGDGIVGAANPAVSSPTPNNENKPV